MPLAYLLSYLGFGLNGIWVAVLISHIVASITAAIVGSKGFSRAKEVAGSRKINCTGLEDSGNQICKNYLPYTLPTKRKSWLQFVRGYETGDIPTNIPKEVLA